MRRSRFILPVIPFVFGALAACSAPAPSDGASTSTSQSIVAGSKTPDGLPSGPITPGTLTQGLKAASDAIGVLSNLFGVFTGVENVIQLVLATNSTSQIETDIQQVESQLTQIYGAVLAVDGRNLLEEVDTYRLNALDAAEETQEWYAAGTPASFAEWADAQTKSLDAVNQLSGNMGLQQRVYNSFNDCPTTPYVSNGLIWDYRVFLPALMEAVDARLAVLAGLYPGFPSRTGSDAALIEEEFVSKLQPIADRIEAGASCTPLEHNNITDVFSVTCEHQLWTDGENQSANLCGFLDWYQPIDYLHLTAAQTSAAIAAVREQMYEDIGLSQLKALIAQLRSYEQPIEPQIVSGDFNGDHKTDVALVGYGSATTLPIAFSNGDGTFRVTNSSIAPSFIAMALTPGAKVLAGDFSGDGVADLVLFGASNQNVITAVSSSNGSFNVFSFLEPALASAAMQPGVKIAVADLNGDKAMDLVLTGATGSQTIGIALSEVFTTFYYFTQQDPTFDQWSSAAGSKLAFGKFDGQHGMLATSTMSQATSFGLALPTASATLDQQQFVAGGATAVFAGLPSGTMLAGDFDGNGYDDLASWVGGVAQISYGNNGIMPAPPIGIIHLPIGFLPAEHEHESDLTLPVGIISPINLPSAINVVFENVVRATDNFSSWATQSGATVLGGDFDGDGISDFAMSGGQGWTTIPVAFSRRSSAPVITNYGVANFPTWAQQGLRGR